MTLLGMSCHAGLELFFIDALGAAAGNGPTWAAPSAFFAFGSEEERERANAVLTVQAALGSSLPGGRSAAAAAGSILEVPFPQQRPVLLVSAISPWCSKSVCGHCLRRTCQARILHSTSASTTSQL